jgi:hypothetical protein
MIRKLSIVGALLMTACSASRSDADAFEYFHSTCNGCSDVRVQMNEDEVSAQTFEATYKDSAGRDRKAFIVFTRSTETWSVREQ